MAEKIKILRICCGLWLLACSLIFVSCSQPLYKNGFIIAGTYLEVVSPSKEAAGIVYQEFKRLNRIFNFYDPQSELSRLNQSYNQPFNASGELIEVLQLSKKIYEETNGALDVSCGALYSFWKGLIKEGKIEEFPSPKKIERLKSLCGMDNIEIDSQKNTVTIKKEGLKIDLGGIAKGYIVQRGAEKLKTAGIDSALINAGGDIYCLGKNKYRLWKVGIKDPKHPQNIIESESLSDKAIVTSGNYEQFFDYRGQRYSHLINPRTGYPVKSDWLSVSVVSSNCAIADSLATAFFIMGQKEVSEFILKSPYDIKVFIVRFKDGQISLNHL